MSDGWAMHAQMFARDLEQLYTGMASMDSEVILKRSREGGAVTAALGLDDAQLNRMLLQIVQIGNDHGIRFPRELGMLLKQLLYFDRCTFPLISRTHKHACEQSAVAGPRCMRC